MEWGKLYRINADTKKQDRCFNQFWQFTKSDWHTVNLYTNYYNVYISSFLKHTPTSYLNKMQLVASFWKRFCRNGFFNLAFKVFTDNPNSITQIDAIDLDEPSHFLYASHFSRILPDLIPEDVQVLNLYLSTLNYITSPTDLSHGSKATTTKSVKVAIYKEYVSLFKHFFLVLISLKSTRILLK